MFKFLLLLFLVTSSYANTTYQKNLYQEGCYDIVNKKITVSAAVVESFILGVKLTMQISINNPEMRNYEVNLRGVCKKSLNEKLDNPAVNVEYALLKNTLKSILASNGFRTQDYKRLLK